jgi:hypothetical protein
MPTGYAVQSFAHVDTNIGQDSIDPIERQCVERWNLFGKSSSREKNERNSMNDNSLVERRRICRKTKKTNQENRQPNKSNNTYRYREEKAMVSSSL